MTRLNSGAWWGPSCRDQAECCVTVPRFKSASSPTIAPCTISHGRTTLGFPPIRKQLIEVVLGYTYTGYTGLFDEKAARAGMEWMRERYRELGQAPKF